MIITGNTTIIGNLTGNTGNTGNQPQPATRPAFITPKVDTSIWSYLVKDELHPDWVVTKGTQDGSPFATAYSLLSPWEIQHDIPDADDVVLFNGRLSLHGQLKTNEKPGTDIAEVRLVIPDEALPQYVAPPATPDKPYLVAGFVLRLDDHGNVGVYGLDDSAGDGPVRIVGGANYFNLEIAIRSTYLYAIDNGYGYSLFPLIRTAVKTPVNKLCISSGTNPAFEVNFQLLSSVVFREQIKYTLTPEDEGATFYSPDGCVENTVIYILDTPFPQGFSVNIINDNNVYMYVAGENFNNNILLNEAGNEPKTRVDLGKGQWKLIQKGSDGKTWEII
ncbi:hypothetical protein RJV04_001231 [Salmonella enterica]|nr:hypothetical protein [Salmonella enterica]